MWYSNDVYVIKTPDINKLKDFLESFGLKFQQEQHGKGPVHYSCQNGNKVLEIYPEKVNNG